MRQMSPVRPRRPASPGLPSPKPPAGARAGGFGGWRLDQPASSPGTTAAHPVAVEAIVTPSLTETSSFRMQPADPVPAPGSVPFDSGAQHTGGTVQPPPVTTTASSTAPPPGAPYDGPSWVVDDFAVERALLAGKLPTGFDASRLIAEARAFAGLGFAAELAAGQLPIQTIDLLLDGYRANDEGAATRCTSSISTP